MLSTCDRFLLDMQFYLGIILTTMSQISTDTVLKRFPNAYNHEVMEARRIELGMSQRAVARKAKINMETVKTVFKGRSKGDKVYPVAKVLGLDWREVHNLKLKKSEFHLALVNGDGAR